MISKFTYSSALFKKSFPHTATGSSCLLRAVKKRQHPKMLLSVRAKGLEPIRTRHQILSLACLPISTRPPVGSKGRKKASDFKTVLPHNQSDIEAISLSSSDSEMLPSIAMNESSPSFSAHRNTKLSICVPFLTV